METVASVAQLSEAGGESLEKRGWLPERLQKRDEERQREAERKRQEKEKRAVLEEKSEHFSSSFGPERAAIEELLAGAEPGALEEAATRLQRLQKLLNDSIMFLPSYDIRQAQDAISRLQGTLDGKRQQLQPRGKFTFKSRKKQAAAATSFGQPPPVTVDPQPSEKGLQPEPICGLQGLSSQILFMEAAEIQKSDVLLSQLRDCTVTLRGSPATLHLRGLIGCTVLCGPVSSSVFVHDCTGCLFAFPCQQLRAHNTTESRFYLHVTSRAIIEDCSDVHFAPFTWSYEGIQRDYEVAGLDRAINNWELVDDFNWLARDVKSPNWNIIPEENRVTHWN
ncbi:tubulin-specific chaperone C [Rhinophrynus dorsalis]